MFLYYLEGLRNKYLILGSAGGLAFGAPDSFICWSVPDTLLRLVAHVNRGKV